MIFKYFIIFTILCSICFRLSIADGDENLESSEALTVSNEQTQTDTINNEMNSKNENDSDGSLFNKLFLGMVEKNRKLKSSSSEKVKTLSFSRPSQFSAQPMAVQYADQSAGQTASSSATSNSFGGATIQLASNPQSIYQYQQQQVLQPQQQQQQQTIQQSQQVYIDPTTGQIVDPNAWMIAQQNALLVQQQQKQQQSQLTQRMMMNKKNTEYFGSEAYKNRRMNNTLREQRLKLLNDEEFLQNHQKIGQFIIAKNLDNPELLTETLSNDMIGLNEKRIRNNPAHNGGYMNMNKNPDKNKFKQYYNNFLNLNDEKVKTHGSSIQSKNLKLNNYEKLDFPNVQENDPINRKAGRYVPKFQIVMDDQTDEGIQMNSIKRTSTPAASTTLPNCVDTTTTKSSKVESSETSASTSKQETTTASSFDETTSSSATSTSSKSAKPFKRKNKSYNLANIGRPTVNNMDQDDDGEDQFLTLSKKFDLKEKQYKEFLIRQQSRGALDQQHRQNYEALMNDNEKVMKLSQNNNQAESNELNNNNENDNENLVKLSANTDSESSSFIDDLIEHVDSSRINENTEQSNSNYQSAQEFHPSETVEQLNQEQIDPIDSNIERENLHTINNHARRERIRHIKNLNKNKSNSGIKKLSFKRPSANTHMEDDDFNPRHQPMYHNGYVQDQDLDLHGWDDNDY